MPDDNKDDKQDDDQDIDLDALQDNIDDALSDDNDEGGDDESLDDDSGDDDDFDLDGALDSFEPITLDGKISAEEAETKAAERGWRKDGKDKYGHQISAIEFLERTPLFHKMDLMRGDVDDLKKQNKRIIEQNKKIAQSKIDAEKKHVEALKTQKKELLDSGALDADDITELKKLDEQISESDVAEPENEDIVRQYEDRKDQFVADNPWYKENRAMMLLADNLGHNYVKDYHEKHNSFPDPDEMFEYVVSEVKKDFPDMGKPKRSTRVATRTNRTVTKKHTNKKTIQDLPEEMRAIAKEVMDSAGLSEDEYLKTYVF